MKYTNNYGFIEFNIVKDKYEFEDESSKFWDKIEYWIEIDQVRVKEKFKGNGTKLMKDFINSLQNTGIVLNAVP